MFIIPDMESTRKGKDQREQGKGKREKTPPRRRRDERRGFCSSRAKTPKQTVRTGWRAGCRLRVSTDQFSICVFLSKQGAKLKSERVSWLSKLWALYSMTDLGSILSFFISGFNNTTIVALEFPSNPLIGMLDHAEHGVSIFRGRCVGKCGAPLCSHVHI